MIDRHLTIVCERTVVHYYVIPKNFFLNWRIFSLSVRFKCTPVPYKTVRGRLSDRVQFWLYKFGAAPMASHKIFLCQTQIQRPSAPTHPGHATYPPLTPLLVQSDGRACRGFSAQENIHKDHHQ